MSKSKRITIINYGMGNIASIVNALDLLGYSSLVTDKSEDIGRAEAIILPGVGAFPKAMENLINLDLIQPLKDVVMGKGVPFLGICLGMQLLALDSTEQGYTKGLGWIDGHVVDLKPSGNLHVPHVGWNTIKVKKSAPLFERIDEDANFYFDHSYHVTCDENLIAAGFEYGDNYVAAIKNDNIFATQFHPEKSQRNGLKLLRNFLNYVEAQTVEKGALC